jgi:glycerate kinase
VKVLIAPQEFKGTLTAGQAAEAIMRGIQSAQEQAEVDVAPIADGGAGTVEVLLAAGEGEERFATVSDPLGRPVRARWALIDRGATAVIEMAAASGLALLTEGERDPLSAHTFGTGELIRAALDAGATRILIGAGGSATCDGGVGAATALGVRFLDEKGAPLPLGPRHFAQLASIDRSGLDPRLQNAALEVLTDVRNPLLGKEGSARVYAPQKGADEDDVDRLDLLLEQLARVSRQLLHESHETEAGAGAAGGLGFGLRAFCNARLRRGFDVVSEALGLFTRVNECDWVLTGEGRLDLQSAYFKGPYALGRLARMQKKRVILFAGSVLGGSSGVRDAFDEVVVVGKGRMPDPADAAQQLEDAVQRWALRQSK